MAKPRALRSGDTVRMVSPASPVTPDKLQAATDLLSAAGYRVEMAPHALDREGYLAGTDLDRAADLQDAFDDPAVGAVYCTRGGYGSARLLPLLDLDRMAAVSKLFLGFSDVTTIHLALNRRGLPTVHAPMGLTLNTPREQWVLDSLLACMAGEDPITASAPKGSCIVSGSAEGVVTGGCLCLLTDSLGTAEELDARGKIVLIEDVDENPHRIDAMLTHLLLAGTLDDCAGIVVGEMTRTDERQDESIGSRPWLEIVAERLGPLGRPMIAGFPFGHMKQMLSLPLGIRARLDADPGTLTYLESLCG